MYKNGQKITLRAAKSLSFFFCCFYSFSAFASTHSSIDSIYSSEHSNSIRAANEENYHNDNSSQSFSNPIPAVVFSSISIELPSISIVASLRAFQVPHKLYLIVKSGNSPPLA
jgi:hypothetical protein